ncbi:MAG: nuclear transport factor 2 family protein [Acidimicrobiales bacterium]|nr:nuclear transport factor 2 family protein [Acidimicrobiales bacterium]
MADPDDIRRLLEGYAEAWKVGDLEVLLGAYADDVVFHYFGGTDLAGAHVGKEAAVQAMVTVSTRAARELLEVVDVLAGDRLGTLVVRERLVRDGEQADVQRVFLYRVDGKRIVECWVLDEDQALIDRFWRS